MKKGMIKKEKGKERREKGQGERTEVKDICDDKIRRERKEERMRIEERH